MNDMVEVVIRIPKELYINVLNSWEKIHPKLYKALKNGTVLPKGHGRLIDANEIQFENAEFDTYGDYSRAFDAIDQADTVIEADKGESE